MQDVGFINVSVEILGGSEIKIKTDGRANHKVCSNKVVPRNSSTAGYHFVLSTNK